MNNKFLVFVLLLSFTLYSAEESKPKYPHKFTQQFSWEFEHQNTFWFTGLCWSHDSQHLITSSTDSIVRIWDGIGDVVKSCKFEGCTLNNIAAAHNSEKIAISYNDIKRNTFLAILYFEDSQPRYFPVYDVVELLQIFLTSDLI